ncbi:hypothetical protein JOL62DRAFT_53128 [Phyllosticta paracitricarpa]|uniref:Secreted protein n=1 Tax=Phyllosticta paracitricarpa TaxID=2016321 RepID=A0ABR1NBW8_9PEZI
MPRLPSVYVPLYLPFHCMPAVLALAAPHDAPRLLVSLRGLLQPHSASNREHSIIQQAQSQLSQTEYTLFEFRIPPLKPGTFGTLRHSSHCRLARPSVTLADMDAHTPSLHG